MKVRMRVHVTGTRDGHNWPPIGGELDVPDAEGTQLCAVGMAVPVPESAVETPKPPAPEQRKRATRKA